MKILIINSVIGVGSTGRICTDMMNLLNEKGDTVKIAYGRKNADKKYKYVSFKVGKRFDIHSHVIYTRLFDKSGFGSKIATKRFVDWIKEYDPDIIHLHNLHGYYVNIEILFSYLRHCNKKIIWTLHDCWAFTGHCSHFDYINCNKWINGCYSCEQKREYPKSLLLDNSKINYERKKELFTNIKNMTIITPSIWLSKIVSKSFLKDYKIKVINNGIDVSTFKPKKGYFRNKFNLVNKTIILGVSNNWDAKKGYYDFLKLSEKLLSDQVIVMVGVSKKQLKELPSNIIGIQRTNNISELVEIYSDANVLFNPTYEDNYPTINLESQACGTPVISYATGGSIESIPMKNIIPKGAYNLVPKMANSRLMCKIFDWSKESMLQKYEELYYENIIYNKSTVTI